MWKLRIYTDQAGTWSWTTSSNVPGLNGRSGTIGVSGTLPGVFGKGPVVENPANPRTFMYQQGGPVFLTAKFLDAAAPNPLKYSHTMFSQKLTDTYLAYLVPFTQRVDFARMAPDQPLVLSGSAYSLAERGRAYVFYLYSGGTVRVDLRGSTGTLIAEWYDPRTGAYRSAPSASGGTTPSYTVPASGDWVLYIHK